MEWARIERNQIPNLGVTGSNPVGVTNNIKQLYENERAQPSQVRPLGRVWEEAPELSTTETLPAFSDARNRCAERGGVDARRRLEDTR